MGRGNRKKIVSILGIFTFFMIIALSTYDQSNAQEGQIELPDVDDEIRVVEEAPPPAAPTAGTGGGITNPEPPDDYIIQSGDTLWDISERFFNDAFFWPKVWSYNPYITNPHWIYPGNRLVFKPGTLTEPPSVEVAPPREPGEVPVAEAPVEEEEPPPAEEPAGVPPAVAEPAEEIDSVKEGAMELAEEMEEEFGLVEEEDEKGPAATITLREDGFITPFPQRSLGEIAGSPMEIHELSMLQELYLDMKRPKKVQVGDLYTVFRTVKHIFGTGYLNQVLGVVEITSTRDRKIKGMITRSFYPILREDKVMAYYEPLHQVAVREATSKIKGRIVERLNYNTVDIGQGDVIYLDKGKRQGVEAGYVFYILRKGDGVTGDWFGYPDKLVGKAVVVVPRKNNSTAVVTYSTHAIHVGDEVYSHYRE